MAKASKGRSVDNLKLQEIIGRALTDQKFSKRLMENAKQTLAEYELDKATLDLVQRGLKLKGQLDQIGGELSEDFGLKYQSV